jgi:acetyl esterase
VQKHDRAHPDISPLFAEDVKNVPRTLIYSAGFDPLRDEARAYGDALAQAGNSVLYEELESMVHGFVLMGGAVPAAREASRRIFERIGEELRGA